MGEHNCIWKTAAFSGACRDGKWHRHLRNVFSQEELTQFKVGLRPDNFDIFGRDIFKSYRLDFRIRLIEQIKI